MNQRKKPCFTLAFKQDAAQLILRNGYTYTEAATSLGVSVSALRKWVNAEKEGKHSNSSSKTVLNLNEHEELLRLRKENNRLKMEREILKKAAVFFAQDHR